MSVIAWKRTGVIAVALGLAPAVWAADVPALDRVPAGTPMIIAVPNLAKLEAGFAQIEKTFGMEPEEGPFAEFKLHQAMKLDGINKQGSMALAVMADEEGKVDFQTDEPPAIMIVPVSDYAKFAAAGGADPAAAVGEWNAFDEPEPGYCRNLGNGFAAISPDRTLVEGFKGTPGNSGAHMNLLGSNGRGVLDGSLVTVILDLQALAPQIKEGIDGVRQTMEEMAQAAGQPAGNAALFDALGESITRDGQSAAFGFTAGESGAAINMGAQFKEGSQTAGYFAAKGKAGALLERVPNQPYLFAIALDVASPGLKQMFKTSLNRAAEADPDAAAGLVRAMLKSMDTTDGASFMIGMSPALMAGGFFSNTMAYVKTRDPAGFAAAVKESMAALDGKTVQGLTYQTSYTPGAKSVGGVSADQWSMRMEADPDDPNSQQAMMAVGMIFGMEGGPTGYVAPAQDGVDVTYSTNTQLLEQALSASKGGGLGTDAGIKGVAGSLPADRTVEGYFGVKSIMELAQGVMAMMGGGGPEFDIPADLPPIGFGGSTTGGGVRMTLFAPTQVLTTIKKAGENMGGGQPDGAGQPRF